MDPWRFLLTGSLLREGKARCDLRACTVGAIPAHLPSEAKEPSLPPAQPYGTGAGKAAREEQRVLLALHEPYLPRELQRALLKGEAVTAVEAELAASNRLAACPTATGALLCYPAGVNSEALALTPVQLAGEEGEEAAPGGLPALKVGCTSVAVVASSALLQLAAAALGSAVLEAPRTLLAARTAYSVTLLAPRLVEAGEGPEQWELGGGRTWTTRQPLADLCWSGASPGQGAALTQDLRLLGFAADQGQGLELLWHGSAYLEDLHAAPPAVGGGPGRAGSTYDLACCCWGHHPRVVVISTGRRLLSVDVRAAGGGAAVPLWACARGEGLLALTPSGQGAPGQAQPYLAALTTRQLLLFDLRRPHLPAAAWDLPPPLYSRSKAAPPHHPLAEDSGVLEAAAASATEHMQRAQHALQLLSLPPAWLSKDSGSSSQQAQQGQQRQQSASIQGRPLFSPPGPSTLGGCAEEGPSEAAATPPQPHVGCVLHTDLEVGATTAYCFQTGGGRRLAAAAPGPGSRVGSLALDFRDPSERPAAAGQAAGAAARQEQQGSPPSFLPMTQASQAPPAWAVALGDGDGEVGAEPGGLSTLQWDPAFMSGRACGVVPQRVADPLRHRPRMAAALAQARRHAVQQAQLAAHAGVAAQGAEGSAGGEAAGTAAAAAAGPGEGAALAAAGSLGEGVPELHGASAVRVPSPSRNETEDAVVLFRLTSAGDILISQIASAASPAAAAAPGGAPAGASAGAGPSSADPPGFEPPLLWPASTTQPAELLLGAGAAEARIAGSHGPKRVPAWLQQGKNLVDLPLHTRVLELRLEELQEWQLPPDRPPVVRSRQQSHSGGGDAHTALRTLQQELHSVEAPVTLWELHARATLAGAGAGEEEEAEQLPQRAKRRKGPAAGRQRRPAPQSQHASVPRLSQKVDLSEAALSERFSDPVPPFQRMAAACGLLERQLPEAQSPEQGASRRGSGQQRQQQQQPQQQPGAAAPPLFPPSAWVEAAAELGDTATAPDSAAAGTSSQHAQAEGAATGPSCWQAAVHVPALKAPPWDGSLGSQAGAGTAGGGSVAAGGLHADPQLSRRAGYGLVLVGEQHTGEGLALDQGDVDAAASEVLKKLQEQWREDWPQILAEQRGGSS